MQSGTKPGMRLPGTSFPDPFDLSPSERGLRVLRTLFFALRFVIPCRIFSTRIRNFCSEILALTSYHICNDHSKHKICVVIHLRLVYSIFKKSLIQKGYNIMEIVAKRIRELRKQIDISQAKLAAVIGTQQPAINRYENNQNDPPYELLLWYADYFDVSLDYIFGRTDKPQGVLYDYEPEALKEKFASKEQAKQFIEFCFEEGSPMNEKLKEVLAEMIGGKK
jgi:transcriptional regulator with XRE-family HTH domain